MWKDDIIVYHGGFFVPDATPHRRAIPLRDRQISFAYSDVDAVITPTRNHAPLAVDRNLGRRRKVHWSAAFQQKFSRWLSSGENESEMEVLGYGREALRAHLERQLPRNMTWEMYAGLHPYRAKKVWVVDHIVPKRLFDVDAIREAYALSNLRPLCIAENMRKGGVREHLL